MDASVLLHGNFLSKSKLISPDEADNAKSQYDEFVGFEGKLQNS